MADKLTKSLTRKDADEEGAFAEAGSEESQGGSKSMAVVSKSDIPEDNVDNYIFWFLSQSLDENPEEPWMQLPKKFQERGKELSTATEFDGETRGDVMKDIESKKGYEPSTPFEFYIFNDYMMRTDPEGFKESQLRGRGMKAKDALQRGGQQDGVSDKAKGDEEDINKSSSLLEKLVPGLKKSRELDEAIAQVGKDEGPDETSITKSLTKGKPVKEPGADLIVGKFGEDKPEEQGALGKKLDKLIKIFEEAGMSAKDRGLSGSRGGTSAGFSPE